jgi:hypothetical protein
MPSSFKEGLAIIEMMDLAIYGSLKYSFFNLAKLKLKRKKFGAHLQ